MKFSVVKQLGRLTLLGLALAARPLPAAQDWLQFKFDARHSGNAPQRSIALPLGLLGAAPLTDAVFTAPVVSASRVYVVDGAGVATCLDALTLQRVWQFTPRGGAANCNNVSSPAIAGRYVHYGTMAGSYYVLDKATGAVVKEIRCGEPIFSAPVVTGDRVYFATLGGKVYALNAAGALRWTWDFVKEQMKFNGDRWSGRDWLAYKQGGKVTRFDQFQCSRNLAADKDTVILPAGGVVVWLKDTGSNAERAGVYVPPRTPTPTLGLSVGEDGSVYRQWHWLDNHGQVDILRWAGGKLQRGVVPGTQTSTGGGLVSFCSVSLRGDTVYRCRPEAGFGLCRHTPDRKQPQPLGGYPSIAPPILLRDQAVYGGLDGKLYVVPLKGNGPVRSFATAFGKAISAPVAVCDGRVYFGCEDGYLYALGPDGQSPLPTQDLRLTAIRSPLTGKFKAAQFDRFTSFQDWGNSNWEHPGLEPPLQLKWIRRYEGTAKHFSTFGHGRMYTHTAEGQIFAVEEETGRLLWRVYYPGVHISYTSPLYYRERVLVPQAGLDRCRLRCLDAATGRLLWEAPFAGSPSWNREMPPVVSQNVAIYMFSTGRYGPKAPRADERALPWLFEHQNIPGFPPSHHPMLRAYDLQTGRIVWEKDFSEYGAGGDDAGICRLDDTLYYSCFFGYAAKRRGQRGPEGLTAALDPATGKVRWLTTNYSVRGGCTISGAEGRLYLGGYNRLSSSTNRYVWCLDARDGSLVWRSDPLLMAIHVVTVGPKYLFVHAQYERSYVLDKQTGHILATLGQQYKCTRFTLSGNYLLGSNQDVIDLQDPGHIKLTSTGPRLDCSECIGAVVSNGRLFYTAHGSGLQCSQVYGAEADQFAPPWGKR